MSRVQLALNVDDLDEAITFYSKLFGVAPAKIKPGYANFAVIEPPLKLVLLGSLSWSPPYWAATVWAPTASVLVV